MLKEKKEDKESRQDEEWTVAADCCQVKWVLYVCVPVFVHSAHHQQRGYPRILPACLVHTPEKTVVRE